ncbi:glycosyltransferase family 2 protein [Lacinutrix sp.]|uniref:glycosyltransferase family 2 protein n=1 Tax=Lacinutrix sp. TaxID=1937692 RepID=UPI0026316472|nr:glycosyltransferase family 2 protein [Lacinutrix sp.]MDG1714109.1 glycosyltransferase family 2 protein [Lacinutrix sp.]
MLSVLIPTYNYDISKLVAAIHAQLTNCAIAFEIIILEDGSTLKLNSSHNLDYTKVIKNTQNIGRVKARQDLALKAKYDWLLFLDADVFPKSKQFIYNYIKAMSHDYEAFFGGFAYHDDKPEQSFILRWKYGQTKEQIPASTRNKSPYKVIISANYLIKKEVFSAVNTKIEDTKGYGFDNYFGALLQDNNAKVWHIDNEVYHLGIEKSESYLQKKEQAALTLIHFYKTEGFNNHSNDLLRLFRKLNNFKLAWLFSLFYKFFNSNMKKNLLSNSPSVKILQLYRISFMCYAYKNKMIT